jgi:hypothetical protein
VEPNGKDCGINVRKKVETILGIINDTTTTITKPFLFPMKLG